MGTMETKFASVIRFTNRVLYNRTHPGTVPRLRCGISAIRKERKDFISGEKTPIITKRTAFIAGGASLASFLTLIVPGGFLELSAHAGSSPSADVEEQVLAAIRKSLKKVKAAGLLRLVFHDAGTFDLNSKTGGMNGSIVYELDRPESAGLYRSVRVLEKIRNKLPPSTQISWADLIAVAGAEAVSLCGGPKMKVRLGRKDSGTADPENRMPSETLTAIGLKDSFQSKGFSVRELVVLSGAHSLGSKGFGDPFTFDNTYFKILLERPWEKVDPADKMGQMIGIPSDRAISYDPECLTWIEYYAKDQGAFFKDFEEAYLKLVDLGLS